MTDDLYFLVILAQALREPCRGMALRRAFGEIEAMGAEPRYGRGYRQYMTFMNAVRETFEAQSEDATSVDGHGDLQRPRLTAFIVERDGEPLASFVTDGSPMARILEGVKPGHHSLRLDSGRVLWEGELTEAHLLWEVVFPGRPLRMAADTGQTQGASTLEVSLLDRTLRLRSYPGVGSGYLELELTTRRASQP